MKPTYNIAIFISGTGSNAERIMTHFETNKNIRVALLLSNNPNSPALLFAQDKGVKTFVFDKTTFLSSPEKILDVLQEHQINFIVLAGFLLKAPPLLVDNFSKRIINIHPALLPKFGGKGMYGNRVHQTVFEAKEKESGITIHYVNEHYDEGDIIAQFKVGLTEHDTPETIEQKVRILEKEHFAPTIEKLLSE